MALTEEHKKNLLALINQAEKNGEKPEFIQSVLIPKFKEKYDVVETNAPLTKTDTATVEKPTETPAWYNVPGMFNQNAQKAISNIKQEANLVGQGKQSSLTGGLYSVGHAIGAFGNDLGSLFSPLINNPVSKAIIEGAGAVGRSGSPLALSKANPQLRDTTIKPTPKYLSDIGKSIGEHPEWGNRLGSAVGVAGIPIGGVGLKTGANIVKPIIGKTGKVFSEIGKVTEQQVNKAAELAAKKGIKFNKLGNITPQENIINNQKAVKIIAKYKDETGTPIEGLDKKEVLPTPKTTMDGLDAIIKTKKVIYDKYHKMATDAGDGGSLFNNNPVLNIIDKQSKDIHLDPEIRAYAESNKNAIKELAGQPPDVIESRIAYYNNQLKPYYENTDKVGIAKAKIDAELSKALREQLDKQLTETVGPGYQQLKNEYGALKAVERGYANRARLQMNKAPNGFFDITDIITTPEIVLGVITANPGMVAKGTLGRLAKEAIKHINDPDRYVKKSFKTAFKYAQQNPDATNVLNKILTIPNKSENISPNLDIAAFKRRGIKLPSDADTRAAILRDYLLKNPPKVSMNLADIGKVDLNKDLIKYLTKPEEAGVYRGIYRNDIRYPYTKLVKLAKKRK